MGDIKDIVDLISELSNRVENRHTQQDLRDILKQVMDLQKEWAELADQNRELRHERDKLTDELEQLRTSNQESKKEDVYKLTPPPEILQEMYGVVGEDWNALVEFAHHPNGVTGNDLAYQLDCSEVKARYFIDELVEKDLVSISKKVEDIVFYALTAEGRRLLYQAGELDE